MKKKNNYFLDLHKELMATGKLKYQNGLCYEIEKHEDVFGLLKPTEADTTRLINDGLDVTYWASEMKYGAIYFECDRDYTPLRQTIVLFCHEILNS